MKYSESKTYVEMYGEEKCKQMDAYYEDLYARKKAGLEKLIANLPSLFEKIIKKTGIAVPFTYTVEKASRISEDDSDKRIEIESEDFSTKYGVIGNAWKKMVIDNFGGGFYKVNNKDSYYRNEEDYSKPCPEVRYNMSIEYRYESYSGGTNGTGIGYAEASEKTNWEWTFVMNKED